jgi:hypothetical protein
MDMGFRGLSTPKEFYFLCMLHNIGATRSDKSLTLEEISVGTATELEEVRVNLEKLMNTDYVDVNFNEGIEKYYITTNGIRKVLSMWS